ncbi:hypothetical protein OSI99_23225, partial [Mycobacterium ulcerans]
QLDRSPDSPCLHSGPNSAHQRSSTQLTSLLINNAGALHRRQPGRAPLADPNSLSGMTRSKACLVAASATSRASRS